MFEKLRRAEAKQPRLGWLQKSAKGGRKESFLLINAENRAQGDAAEMEKEGDVGRSWLLSALPKPVCPPNVRPEHEPRWPRGCPKSKGLLVGEQRHWLLFVSGTGAHRPDVDKNRTPGVNLPTIEKGRGGSVGGRLSNRRDDGVGCQRR